MSIQILKKYSIKKNHAKKHKQHQKTCKAERYNNQFKKPPPLRQLAIQGKHAGSESSLRACGMIAKMGPVGPPRGGSSRLWEQQHYSTKQALKAYSLSLLLLFIYSCKMWSSHHLFLVCLYLHLYQLINRDHWGADKLGEMCGVFLGAQGNIDVFFLHKI